MPKKIKILWPFLISVSIIAGMLIGYKIHNEIPEAKNFFLPYKNNTISQVFELIRTHYVDTINQEKLLETTLTNTLKNLDPFSTYIPPSRVASMNEQLQGHFQGIGIEYTIIRDTPTVLRVIPEGPSEKAGLYTGDKLLKVDTHTLIGKGRDIAQYIKGEKNTTVALHVLRAKKTHTISVTRGIIPLHSSQVSYMITNTIGYIKLDKFTTTSAQEVAQALINLQKQGMKSLIFDLRNNGGGLLESAIDIIEEFLPPEKLITYTKNEHRQKTEYRTRRKGLFEKGTLIILLNGYSASASEIMAGALQDWDRATIIGSTSFGKGLVQEQYTLQNNGALRLTIAKYYTPSGRCIQKNYVTRQQIRQGIVHYDSTAFQKDTFRTLLSQRTVLSSGGITPDIIVKSNFLFPITDTSLFIKILNQPIAYELIVDLLSQNIRQYKKRYPTPAVFFTSFSLPDPVLNTLMKKLGLPLTKAMKNALKEQYKTDLLKMIWTPQEWQPLINYYDEVVKKSIEYIRHHSPLNS